MDVQKTMRKRTSKPKVKTGCKTCKARRVKCDEQKPDCRNCTRTARQCFYAPPPKDVFVLQNLAPKPIASSNFVKAPSPIVHFTSHEERRYFKIFQEKTASSIAGHFNASLWNRTVLQACERNPALKGCVIAIGALDETMRSKRNHSRGAASHQANPQTHCRYALRQYGNAIKQIKKSLHDQPDMRTGIIACLLTVIFESLYGDISAAITQVRAGLRLIRSYVPAGKSAIDARLGGADDIHEVLQVFDRMDNDCVVAQDTEPVQLNIEDELEVVLATMRRMPKVFSSLQEANAYFEFISNIFLHWIAARLAWGSKQGDEAKLRNLTSVATTQLANQRDAYLQAFSLWNISFQPLLKDSLEQNTSRTTRAMALTLDIRWKILSATLSVNHFRGEMEYDQVTDRFREVVKTAHQLAACEENTNDPKYSSQGPLILSIYSVCLKCRDRKVRREALSLLEARPRREGVTDSVFQAKIARLQMEIEESGIGENEVIPEENRIRGIKSSADMINHRGTMKYLKKDPATGEFSYRQVEFTW